MHDFHFAIWNTAATHLEEPLFRSANTINAHNTCGGFSPTRPGVIFITKTNGIDIWDFYDQSNKPSITMNIATSAITYFRFQKSLNSRAVQLMAYGDECEGTLNLQELSPNLKNPQENEVKEIKRFWDNELVKYDYVLMRRPKMREEW